MKLVITEQRVYEISGGFKGFSDVVWTVKSHKEDDHITFTYDSHDNEQGNSLTSVLIVREKIGTHFFTHSLLVTWEHEFDIVMTIF